MDKSKLADALRDRLADEHLVDRETLDSLPDDDIIESYVVCSQCATQWVSNEDLPGVIEQARNVEHFFQLSDEHREKSGHFHI